MKTSDIVNTTATVVMAAAAVAVAVVVVLGRLGSGVETASTADRTLEEESWNEIRGGRHRNGLSSAPAQLIVFADFECPACGHFAREVLPRIHERFGDELAVSFRHWPLSYHANARPAALASECAAAQGGFWAFHDRLFAVQDRLGAISLDSLAVEAGIRNQDSFRECVTSQAGMVGVDHDARLAEAIGASGTPTIVLNGVLLGSGPSEAPLIQSIAREVDRDPKE